MLKLWLCCGNKKTVKCVHSEIKTITNKFGRKELSVFCNAKFKYLNVKKRVISCDKYNNSTLKIFVGSE